MHPAAIALVVLALVTLLVLVIVLPIVLAPKDTLGQPDYTQWKLVSFSPGPWPGYPAWGLGYWQLVNGIVQDPGSGWQLQVNGGINLLYHNRLIAAGNMNQSTLSPDKDGFVRNYYSFAQDGDVYTLEFELPATSCQSGCTCGQSSAATDQPDNLTQKICCPSGENISIFFPYDATYCTQMPSGYSCWRDASCASGSCTGNNYGLQRGTCA